MTKRFWILTLVLMISLFLPLQASLADEPTDLPYDAPAPELNVEAEYADELERALSALQAHTPGVSVNYAVRERDDGRYEWDLFFTHNGQLGQAEVRESDFSVRRVRLYDRPADGLTAEEAMAALAREKGAVTIVDLELERDDGRTVYEGEATLDGRRYEFEMTVSGRILEWERD